MNHLQTQPDIQAAVAQFATDYQLASDHVRTICLDLARLRERGVLLQLRITGVAQLYKPATWEELGVPLEDVRRERLTTGVGKLFPKEAIAAIESQEAKIRRALDSLSFEVDAFHPYRLLLKGKGDYDHPQHSAYWTWRVKHDRLMDGPDGWNERKARFTDPTAYAEAREGLIATYTEIAEKAWKSITGRRNAARWTRAPEVLETRSGFIDRLVQAALRRMPSRETIDQTMTVQVIPGMVMNPAEVEHILLDAERTAAERDAIETEQHNRLVIQLLGMRAPEDQVLCEAPGTAYRTATEALAAMERLGYLPTGTRKGLQGLRASYHLMSYTQDTAIEQALTQLDGALMLEGAAAVPGVTAALLGLKDACRPFVERLAEIRPAAWAGIV